MPCPRNKKLRSRIKIIPEVFIPWLVVISPLAHDYGVGKVIDFDKSDILR